MTRSILGLVAALTCMRDREVASTAVCLALVLALAVLWPSSPARAVSLYREDFTGFAGTGFAPVPAAGHLDSDLWRVVGMSDGSMAFGDSLTTGDFARGLSSGGVTTGGVYAFDVGTGNVALGVQPSGADFTSGAFDLQVQNTTGALIDILQVSYSVYVLNDEPRSNGFRLLWGLTSTGSLTIEAALDVQSTEPPDASPAWVRFDRAITLSGLGLAPGDALYLRWAGADLTGTGARDEFALDDVLVEIVPEPGTFGLVGVALLVLGLVRRRSREP